MKLSSYHKLCGNSVSLNMPLFPADHTYASILFEKNLKRFTADEYGGPAISDSCLESEFESMEPDYDLFGLDFSMGYTFRPCFNSCGFCNVPKMEHPDMEHHSIWEFHDARFKKICLLNNNTFQDPKWKETFDEILDANLSIVDENGYDLRLIDDEKAQYLKRLRWHENKLGFAWDRMQDDSLITNGLKIAKKHKLLNHNTNIYILIGYDTTEQEDLYRCQKVVDFGAHPYPMPYKKTYYTKRFKRFINLHYYRKHKTIESAWKEYK